MRRVRLKSKTFSSRTQGGFTVVQMIIAIAIIGVVTTFGVLGIKNARAEMRVQNSARRFAVYVEKARADSIRRHAAAGSEAFVETFGPGTTTFNVRMDFDGKGMLETRTFPLDEGVSFNTIAQTATFDWRGRIAERLAFQIANEIRSIPVDVSGSGDITVGDQIFGDNAIPEIALTTVPNDVVPDATPFPTATSTPSASPSASPSATATPTPTPTANGNGNDNGNGGNGNGNGNQSPTPTPVPTPTPDPTPAPSATPTPSTPPPCTSSVSPGTLSLSQGNAAQKTGTILFTLTNASGLSTISASQAGNGSSLNITVSPTSINGSGSATVTIGAKNGNGNRGSFSVNISASPSCGTAQQVTVTVGN